MHFLEMFGTPLSYLNKDDDENMKSVECSQNDNSSNFVFNKYHDQH